MKWCKRLCEKMMKKCCKGGECCCVRNSMVQEKTGTCEETSNKQKVK